jgi:hypothetical protein
MRRSYVVVMRWMVIYGYEVPGGALNLSSTELPRPWSPWESSPLRKNPHGRTGNRTRDLMISSQKLLTTISWGWSVTWNTDWICGIPYNVCLCGLCAGLSWFRMEHNNPAHRPHKHTLYDIPPIQSVFQVTQTDPRSSLMMADYCRNT